MTSSAATHLKARLRTDLAGALSARRTQEARVLRLLVAALDNAEAVPITDEQRARLVAQGITELPRLALDQAAAHALLLAEIAERTANAATYDQAGRPDEAARLHAQIAVIRRYL